MEKKKSGFENWLNKTLVPLGVKLSSQRHLKAVRDGMASATPLALLGGMTLIVTSPPVDLNKIKPTNFINNFLIAWKNFAIANGLEIELLFRATLGLMGLFVVMGIAYSLAKEYKIDPLGSMFTAAVSFLIIAAPSNLGIMSKMIQESMTTEELLQNQMMVLPTNYLGAEGIFTAIVLGLLTTEITRFFIKKGFIIKMPEGVPPAIVSSFAAIIPLAVCAIGAFLISIFAQKVSGGKLIPELIMLLFKPLVSAVDSPFGIIIISIVTQLLWFVGLHGSSIVSGVVGAFEISNLTINGELLSSGAAPTFIYTQSFRAFFMILGGAGATLGLCLLLLRSKSKHLKTLGKLAILPSIFNINEPIIFGMPLVLNITLFIPFLLVQTVNGLLTYFVMKFDIIGKTIAIVPWTTPAPIGAALSTLDIKAFFYVLILLVIDILIWYPFFKAYEKELILKEKKEI